MVDILYCNTILFLKQQTVPAVWTDCCAGLESKGKDWYQSEGCHLSLMGFRSYLCTYVVWTSICAQRLSWSPKHQGASKQSIQWRGGQHQTLSSQTSLPWISSDINKANKLSWPDVVTSLTRRHLKVLISNLKAKFCFSISVNLQTWRGATSQ